MLLEARQVREKLPPYIPPDSENPSASEEQRAMASRTRSSDQQSHSVLVGSGPAARRRLGARGPTPPANDPGVTLYELQVEWGG